MIEPHVFFDQRVQKWRAVWESAPDIIEQPTFDSEEEANEALGKPFVPVIYTEDNHPLKKLAAQMAQSSRKAVSDDPTPV